MERVVSWSEPPHHQTLSLGPPYLDASPSSVKPTHQKDVVRNRDEELCVQGLLQVALDLPWTLGCWPVVSPHGGDFLII